MHGRVTGPNRELSDPCDAGGEAWRGPEPPCRAGGQRGRPGSSRLKKPRNPEVMGRGQLCKCQGGKEGVGPNGVIFIVSCSFTPVGS